MNRSPPAALDPVSARVIQSLLVVLARLAALLHKAVNERVQLVATIADLTAAVAAHAASDSALLTEVTDLQGDIENLITVFNSVKGGLSAADQSALDAAVAGVTSSAATIAGVTSTLGTEAANIDVANPDPPAPVV